jgi:hypothetical protein
MTRYNFWLGIPAGDMEDPRENRAVDTLPKQTLPRRPSYRPLEGREIRFLALHPYRESVGLLECSLHYGRIGFTKYSALSDTRGDPAETETILGDDKPFQVTSNFAEFLKTLSRGRAKWDWPLDSPLYLLVDAVCINQGDILERKKQVPRMDNIYNTAIQGFIWLSPHVEHTELAFNRLTEIDKEVSQLLEERFLAV